MRAKTKKWFSPLFVLTLAIAGIFGVSAAVLSNNNYNPALAGTINYYARCSSNNNFGYDEAHRFETKDGNAGWINGVELTQGDAFKCASSTWTNTLGFTSVYSTCGAYSNFGRAVRADVMYTMSGSGWGGASVSGPSTYEDAPSKYMECNNTNTTTVPLYLKLSNTDWVGQHQYVCIRDYWNEHNHFIGTLVGGTTVQSSTQIWKFELTIDVYDRGFNFQRCNSSCTSHWDESAHVSSAGDAQGLFKYSDDNIYVKTTGRYDIYATTGYAGLSIEIANYKVTLSTHGGTINAGNVTSYVYGTGATLPTNVTKTGYTFNGWYTAETGGSKVTAVSTTDFGDKEYHAQWSPKSYTITYKDQGNKDFSGTHASGYPTSHTYGTATALKTASKTGYTFDGWFTTSACTGSAVTSLGATAYTTNITLFAKWTANSYRVNFNLNGGSSVTPDYINVTYGSTYGELPTPTGPSGYTFDGWYTAASGGDLITSGTTVSITDTQDLYAHWAIKYTITWVLNNGSADETTQVNQGANPTHSNPSKSSTAAYTYDFTGWKSSGGTTYAKGATLPAATANETYTAQYSETLRSYTITWIDGNGDTLSSGSVNYGVTPTYSGDTPTKDSTAQYTYTWDEGWTPTVTSVTGNTTYTATFDSTLRSYTVTWKNYEDTVLETDNNVNYGTNPSYDGDTPRRSPTATHYYTFKGWTDGTNHYNDGDTIPAITGAKTFTAEFNEYEISSNDIGWFGGETYFFVDQINSFGSKSDNARLRLYFWDEGGATTYFTSDLTSDLVYRTGGNYDTYRIVIPEYTGSSLKGWIGFIVTRYNPSYDSDTTIINEHCWDKTGDLDIPHYWKNNSEWWAWKLDNHNISLSGANNTALYGMTSGTVRYFELGTWNKQGYTGNMAVHFFGAIGDGNGSYTADIVFDTTNQVLGTGSDYSKGLWEFTVPYASTGSGDKLVTWHSYVVVQMKPGQTQIDWDNYQYKSADLNFSNVYNIIKGDDAMDYSISDATRLSYFITYFNSQVGDTCDDDGHTVTSNLITAWNNSSSQLPLENRIANQFKSSTASTVGTNVQQAAARYDYVLNKYGTSLSLTDFAGRKQGGNYTYLASAINSFSPYELIIGSDDNASIILIIIASSISILSITALSVLMVKKKKSANK